MFNTPIICDSGTGYLKLGFAGTNFPKLTLPAMIGRPMLRYEENLEGIQLKDIMIADEVTPCRALCELSFPLEEGMVKNWEDMELIWDYGFKKLQVQTQGASLFMTEAIMNPVQNRAKMAEIKFEKFGFGQLQVGIQALLPLFAEGLMTALLLDAGDGVSHCIPVVEGFLMEHNALRLNIAGRHVTDHLVKLLFMRGYAFNSSADFEVVREIKERFCFVSGDLSVDRKLARETTCQEKVYNLPDGTKIKIGKERFEAPEVLFNPFFMGKDGLGCSEMVFKSINDSPIDLRKDLYNSILISGGTTMFPGFPTRLYNDINKFFKERILKGREGSSKVHISVLDPARRKYNVFIGASFLANIMKDKSAWWISKQEWNEMGSRCLNKISNTIKQ